MEIPGPEPEVATWGGWVAFKHLFRGRQPKIWSLNRCLGGCPRDHPHVPQQPSRAVAASLTCLGACGTSPGCCRAASLPGEPRSADSFQPPAPPASVTTARRGETRCNAQTNPRRHLAAPEKRGLLLPDAPTSHIKGIEVSSITPHKRQEQTPLGMSRG